MQREDMVLCELLYQLADDNFILAYRGSEWLGMAPHIEEDVAFSSINQDMMGHAVMYYQLLEELGAGDVDTLSHCREPESFRNAILLERKNGLGHYLKNPNYDWANTVVRHYLFSVLKQIRLESLYHSSYEPLKQVAEKISSEHYYHSMHWETWFTQLMASTKEARHRMENAINSCWQEFDGVISLGRYGKEICDYQLIAQEDKLRNEWLRRVCDTFGEMQFSPKTSLGMESGNGRNGEHTEDLTEALEVLSEVYGGDKQAVSW
ncbi:1,2-phenylacetyl-CoA epoxidase subunit PaaC [Virgibacillus dokdonensis]|uniref:1,2-phenylacetyl-CoA epoxidase, subunit C n=1 Tax=Virgibacillus dokdonensis TaxID=302167 RepID=A0A2K9J3C8_9BACI|nr:1,2-phenylacetyl-CoA epoxidase subunit PaaC [Virgibacillus dokdonensis]AUJ23500.1 1,2-phenylacetyl-CoA epoxidase, subunit C [Virgibacillus dokdonensis]